MPMLITDKHPDEINGIITCYDRMIIQGYIPGWSHAEGMTSYFYANDTRIFDYSSFSQPLTEQIARKLSHTSHTEIGQKALKTYCF